MDGSVFFPIGGALVVLALVLSAIGIRGKDRFPPSRPVLAVLCVFFFAVVAVTGALAVVNASEEKEHRDKELAEEQAHAEEEAAAEQPVAPPAVGKTPPGSTDASVPPQGGGEPGGSTQLDVSSPEDGSLVFEPDALEAGSGVLEITYANPSAVGHNLALEGDGGVLGETETFTEGEQTLTIDDLPEGEYTFFCSVPGHREGGMEGDLLVQ